MSNIQLHSPLVSFVSVDSLPFRSTHARPSSAPQVINLVDDDADTNAPPPAVRRRLVGTVPDDDDVIIVDPDTSAESNTSGRRISVGGGINRPIVIPDSDEEHSPTRNAPSGPSTQQYQRRDSFRIFSPPPPAPTHHPIPPVPSLPIIANPQPFAILAPSQASEDSSNTSSRRRLPFDEPPQPSTSSTSASRRASNRLGIQLGGGLVSQSIRPRRVANMSGWGDLSRPNGSTSANANANGHGRTPPVGRYIATFLNHDPQQGRNPNHQDLNPNHDQQHHEREHDHHHHHHHVDHALRRYEAAGGWFNPRRAGRTLESAFFFLSRNIIGTAAAAAAVTSVPEYTKDMTHPGVPPPGWSFSFGTESVQSVDVDADDEGATGGGGGGGSGAAPAEYLACALCLDPLHANVEERRDLSVEEKRKKRVWALRCGHMFDGKCIEGLMVPNWQKEKPKMMTPTTTTTGEEKEKEEDKKVVVPADDEPSIDKGKGKAKEDDEDAAMSSAIEVVGAEPVSTPVNIIDDAPPSSQQSQPESTSGSRYNFRTRRPPPPQEQPASSRSSNRRNRAGTAPASSEEPSRKTRGTKRKYDGKAVKNNEPPKIEIRYNWTCPVAGCGKMHSSYKLQDVWKPDEESGPIAIYI